MSRSDDRRRKWPERFSPEQWRAKPTSFPAFAFLCERKRIKAGKLPWSQLKNASETAALLPPSSTPIYSWIPLSPPSPCLLSLSSSRPAFTDIYLRESNATRPPPPRRRRRLSFHPPPTTPRPCLFPPPCVCHFLPRFVIRARSERSLSRQRCIQPDKENRGRH